MLRLPPFALEAPTTVDGVLALLAEHGERAMVVAGGTDLLPNMKHGLFEPDVVVSLANVAALGGIVAPDGGGLRLGATATLDALAASGAVCERAPALAQAAARHLIAEEKPGSIVTVASTSGLKGKALLSGYSASKGAMMRLTEALAAEWARYGIRVNTIAPGAFATDAQSAVLDDEDQLAARLRKIPARRMGQPAEIGPLTCYLLSPLSDFVTGSCFVIDGGEVAKL